MITGPLSDCYDPPPDEEREYARRDALAEDHWEGLEDREPDRRCQECGSEWWGDFSEISTHPPADCPWCGA